jgi:hypothetical protein
MSNFECAMVMGFTMIFEGFTVVFLNPHTQENTVFLKIAETCFALS